MPAPSQAMPAPSQAMPTVSLSSVSAALEVRSPPSLASLAQSVLDASATPRVAGNIHDLRYRDFWLSLNPDPFVLGVLQHGYRLPFRDDVTPGFYREPNNRSALDNLPYLREHVKTLVIDTTVEEVFSQPLCCSPLTVASRYVDGLLRLRMCIDLSRYCLLYTSPSPRDRQKSRMPSSA